MHQANISKGSGAARQGGAARHGRGGAQGGAAQGGGELRVVGTIIALARPIGVIIRKVQPHDRELADQLRRAWTSAANNASEAQHQRGNKRLNRMDDAMGSAREARTCILLAEAYGHVPAELALPLAQQVDACVAQLYRLANPR